MSGNGSATRNGPDEWRQVSTPATRNLLGKIRRFALGTTARVLWQIIGHTTLDKRREVKDAEVFGSAGVWARPRSGDNAEAIVVFLGDDGSGPMIVAVRNEKVRALIASLEDLGEGESMLFAGNAAGTGGAVVKNTGAKVQIKSAGGVSEPLCKQADFLALQTAFYDHIHAAAGSPTSAPLPSFSLPDPPPPPMPNPGSSGTSVLEGE